MSNFTNYLIQAQDLDVSGTSVFSAIEKRTYKDFKICWPTLRDISSISKYKIKEADDEKGIKGDTSSLRKKIKQLEKAGHIKRLGSLCKDKQTVTCMYWVNYGSNNIIADIKAFIKEMTLHPSDHRLVDEKIAVLNKYLSENNQPVDNSNWGGSEKPTRGGSEKPTPLGLRNPPEIKGKEKGNCVHTNSKYLYEKVVQILPPNERMDDGFDLVGSEKKIKHAIAKIGLSDFAEGKEQADKILGKLDHHLSVHKRNKAETGKSKFSNIANWLANEGWLNSEFEKLHKDKEGEGTQTGGAKPKAPQIAVTAESQQAARYAFANTPDFEKANNNDLYAAISEKKRIEFMKQNAPDLYRAEIKRLNKTCTDV